MINPVLFGFASPIHPQFSPVSVSTNKKKIFDSIVFPPPAGAGTIFREDEVEGFMNVE
jgi:hypothetical protein